MAILERIGNRPGYAGLLALATICIIALGVLLVLAFYGVEVDPIVPPAILAGIAVIFVVGATSMERSDRTE